MTTPEGPSPEQAAPEVEERDLTGTGSAFDATEAERDGLVEPHGAASRSDQVTAGMFLVAALAGIGLLVVYVTGGQPQLEGGLLAIALGGIGAGLVRWSHGLTGKEPAIEERAELPSAVEPRREFMATLETGGRRLTRRRLLLGSLTAAGASLLAALLLPVRSLGPAPGRTLFTTPWREGKRLVTAGGEPVVAADLEVGNVLTVFPEEDVHAEDAATLLIRVEPERLELSDEGMDATHEGLVAYSKICTHVGCPVGLYRESTHELVCPCHQSTFAVLQGAEPVFGPATRPLPQLPIGVDDEGYVVALGDYPEPIGPGFWNRGT
jgi:ubiquinol-cytochrome c reductase iron-sulfur subunit